MKARKISQKMEIDSLMLEKHIAITERTCKNMEFRIPVLEYGCVEWGNCVKEEKTDAENGPGTK